MDKKILVVDDDPASVSLIKSVLEAKGLLVDTASSGAEGLEKISKNKPHLLLLDVNMPGENGLETLKKIRRSLDYISVIFISARSEVEEVVEGLDTGADDYLPKPFDPRELVARVNAQLRIKEIRDQLRVANEKLAELVNIDELTGLFNMRSVYQKLDQELQRAQRYERQVGVVMVDMDEFKSVNDDFDHLFGSFVLKEMGVLIQDNIRNIDFGARYGGDEFLIVLTETDLPGAKVFCERLRQEVANKTFSHEEASKKLTVSIGFAVSKNDEKTDARSLIKKADEALYESKHQGRNCSHYFDWQTQKIFKGVDL